MHTAESNFLNFVIEYLSDIKTKFENTLACLSEPRQVQIMKKMEVKNLVTHSLLEILFQTKFLP